MTSLSNGWGEYQRLVLAELERHNGLISDINRNLNDISLSLVLIKERNGKADDLLREHEKTINTLEERLEKMERGADITIAIKKYRKYLIGTAVLLLSSVVIPLIKIVFFPGT